MKVLLVTAIVSVVALTVAGVAFAASMIELRGGH